MGWRSWNCFHSNVDQAKMESIMDRMAERTRKVDGVNTSFFDLGYNNCGLDDNWQQCGAGAFGSFHDAEGHPIINTDRFPDMKSMTDYGHELGLSVGWYMNNCICKEKSWKGDDNITKHMEMSAQAVADYGFDGVKLDGCGQFRNLTWWAELLNATGRPIMIENCHWGGTVPGQTSGDAPCSGTSDISDCPYNFYRTSGDIGNNWGSMTRNLHSTMKFQGEPPLARPGSWAYPDMMEVGRMKTYLEDRSHFGAWVITSSPLILGYNLNDATLTDKVWDIVSNREAIAINQAWAGHPGRQVKTWQPPAPPAPPPASGNLVFALPCDSTDATQLSWSYNSSSMAIVGPSGKCLDAASARDGSGTSMFLNECDGSSLQKFTIGDDGTLNSVAQHGKCVDIWAGSGLPGGPAIQLYGCHGAENEKFVFEGDGRLSSQSTLCLSGRDAAPPSAGGNVELWMKPLDGGAVAAFLLNNGGAANVTISLADLGLQGPAKTRDIWSHMDLPTTMGDFTVELEEHDSALVTFSGTSNFQV